MFELSPKCRQTEGASVCDVAEGVIPSCISQKRIRETLKSESDQDGVMPTSSSMNAAVDVSAWYEWCRAVFRTGFRGNMGSFLAE